VHGRQSVNAAESAFCSAWEKCNQSESEMASAHIKYRWVFALLEQAYNTKIEQIREKDKVRVITSARGCNSKGQVRAEAADDLLALLYANPTEKNRRLLKSRVTRGIRWYKMGQALGWGSFCLVPHNVITNTWLEHTLRVPELDIWLELVRKVNPDVVKAAHILDS
jgi:hypothetical protein